MSDLPPYPPIDPTTYDLIVVGTGLAESVIAAAASSAGKSVLHLDPNPFYGSHFASLSLPDLSSFLHQNPRPSPTQIPSNNHSDFTAVNLATTSPYSHVQISNFAPEIIDPNSTKFNLDVSGPRVLFCADKSIDLIQKSGAHFYLNFESIDSSFIADSKGELTSVPDSRAAIFKDKSLSLIEKNMLMRFFKLVQQHLVIDGDAKISEDDLETPFVDFLTKMKLPPKIKSIILYAIAMVDFDQDSKDDCRELLKTRDGIDQLALYNSSIGRFPNAPGAWIYPLYGQGELPQAFCRRAAVKGCLYVLRMPVVALLLDKGSRHYRGVRLGSGQEILSSKLVLDSSFTVEEPLSSSPRDSVQESLQVLGLRKVKRKVARGICITSSSLKSELINFLVVYPPRCLYPEQATAVRVLQMGANFAVCPSGMFVLYLSALCDDIDQGNTLLRAVIDSLIVLPTCDNPESSFTDQCENSEVKPTLLWSASYIQELNMGQVESISYSPMPDGNLNYNDLLDATVKLFQKMYPDEDFFPQTLSPDNSEDDGGLSLEM
ncbi:GDI domain-containing protein [Cephalotus follicularis]|uniref:Rab escort protein 1 n=1 Tax=Cephalotus follicularis TaxID=3775 RepID=A0A1Q3CSN3_CEPFO|nr:GDI domain-containing protein [Cephalotus follicularis]